MYIVKFRVPSSLVCCPELETHELVDVALGVGLSTRL